MRVPDRLRRRHWARILVVTLAVTLIVVVGVGAAVSLATFNPYNPTWEGTSEFRTMLADDPETDHTFVRSADEYATLGDGDVAIVFAPDESYDPEASAAVREFVERGGTLVVLDNFGPHGNDLLEAVGADMRFDGALLRDEQHYDRAPTMPIADGMTAHRLTVDVEAITLNYGTALHADEEDVVVRTSNVTYLGEEDDEIGDDDELAAYPIVAVESVGEGDVIAIGDPSIAVNEMLYRTDNRAFLANVAASGDRVAIDVSHTAAIPPLRVGLLTVRAEPLLGGLLGLAGIVAIAAIAATGRPVHLPERWRRRVPGWNEPRDPPSIDPAARRAAIRERHPDWDDEHIDRVMAAFNRDNDESFAGNDT